MTRRTRIAALTIGLALVLGADAVAQNLVIRNARILDGTGNAIERGSIVVRDGKIVSVAAGNAAAVPGAREIDAQGRTVMPGFIDAHRHVIQGDAAMWMAQQAQARMQELDFRGKGAMSRSLLTAGRGGRYSVLSSPQAEKRFET